MHCSVITLARLGGAQTNVGAYLAAGLALNGHSVDLITRGHGRDAVMSAYAGVSGMDKVEVCGLPVRHARSSIFKLARYFRERRPAVAFSQLAIANFAAVLARRVSRTGSLNVLVEGTMLSQVGAVDSKEVARLRLVPPLARCLYPMADGVIAVSPDVLSDLRTTVGSKLDRLPTTCLPNPYPLERFREFARQDASLPWGDADAAPILVAVGRLSVGKAFDILIRAFARARAQTRCRLLILGDGPQRDSLEQLARELGVAADVALPGDVANPWSYMSRCAMFVMTSRWEGWGSALMEAMALSLPVVATDCPGGVQVMLKHDVNGLIVPVDDVPALEAAILSILSDDAVRARLAAAARERSEYVDYLNVSARYAEFADSLLSNHHPQ